MGETDPIFDVQAYLTRVGLDTVEHSLAGLTRLHRAQACSIPFENFDIQLGRPLHLSCGGLFDKLVNRKRGGYCFELNGLFVIAVRHLGFDARPLLARVHLTGEPSGRTHQVTLVSVDGQQWLADVGFGAQGIRAPLPLTLDEPVQQDHSRYRLIQHPRFGFLLQLDTSTGWTDLYTFDTGHICPADVAVANHYTETHPDSHFTTMRTAAIMTPSGRRTLRNFDLRIVTDDQEQFQTIQPGEAYLAALDEHFGICLDATYADLKPV